MPSRREMLQHEQMRFLSMTDVQLYSRLHRITKLDKLECFIETAEAFNMTGLARSARYRRIELRQTATPLERRNSVRNASMPRLLYPPDPPAPKTKRQEVKKEVRTAKPTKLNRHMEF